MGVEFSNDIKHNFALKTRQKKLSKKESNFLQIYFLFSHRKICKIYLLKGNKALHIPAISKFKKNLNAY